MALYIEAYSKAKASHALYNIGIGYSHTLANGQQRPAIVTTSDLIARKVYFTISQ